MANDKLIDSSSTNPPSSLRARHGDYTDLARVRAMTDADVDAAIASDPDEAAMEVDWANAVISTPVRKLVTTIRLDADVLDYFKRQGRGYQTKINAVLRHFVQQQSL